MIKVLQVVGDLNYGGVESVIMNYYRNIDRSQVQFDFITTTQSGRFESEIIQFGGKIYRLPRKSKHPFKYMRELKKIIKKNDYDIVHSNTNSASAFLDLYPAKRAKCKIRIAHSHNSSCLVKWQHRIFKPLLPTVTTHRLACSDAAAKWLFGKNKNYKIINNGIDFDKFEFDNEKRKQIREQNGWNDSFIIGNVASFQERKNQRFLIEILPELIKSVPNIKLVLVGQGGTMGALKDLCSDLGVGDYVEFLGARSDVDVLLQGFDVFCFPSIFEGLAVAYVEAIVSGVPVIISDGVPYINLDNRVFRIELDKDKWRDMLIEIVDNKMMDRDIKSDNSLRTDYDIKLLAKDLLDYYYGLVRSNGK